MNNKMIGCASEEKIQNHRMSEWKLPKPSGGFVWVAMLVHCAKVPSGICTKGCFKPVQC